MRSVMQKRAFFFFFGIMMFGNLKADGTKPYLHDRIVLQRPSVVLVQVCARDRRGDRRGVGWVDCGKGKCDVCLVNHADELVTRQKQTENKHFLLLPWSWSFIRMITFATMS